MTRDVLLGKQKGERLPQALLIVVDASNLDNHLRFALQLIDLGLPTVVALNMIDLAKRDGLELDAAKLAGRAGRAGGRDGRRAQARPRPRLWSGCNALLLAAAQDPRRRRPDPRPASPCSAGHAKSPWAPSSAKRRSAGSRTGWTAFCFIRSRGPLILAAILFLMFQAVFSWSAVPADALEAATLSLGRRSAMRFPTDWLRSMIVDGVFAGVGAVIVFLPQILILFLFILVLESTGYMVRAAFIMDRLMSQCRPFGPRLHPLLSSFACAVPGIMATRTIDDPKDRLTTILVAPLMTCSARLPVYTLIIARLHPARSLSARASACRGWSCSASISPASLGALLAAIVLGKTVGEGRRRRIS